MTSLVTARAHHLQTTVRNHENAGQKGCKADLAKGIMILAKGRTTSGKESRLRRHSARLLMMSSSFPLGRPFSVILSIVLLDSFHL